MHSRIAEALEIDMVKRRAVQTENNQHPLRSISVSGRATMNVPPDTATVSFGVRTRDAKLDKAKADNDAKSAKLLKAVRSLGIDEEQIQTTCMYVDLDYNGYSERTINQYICRRDFQAKLKDVKRLDALVSTVLKNGANQLGGITLENTDPRKWHDRARAQAIGAAREKAVALAKELQMEIGKPRTIVEGGVYVPQIYATSAAAPPAAGSPAGGADGSGFVTPLGQIAITADLQVTFDMK
jgi:hypothetical protein